jgi:dephospho-CoA kinase
MKWIGLTGGIATGKSTVAQILRTKGYVVVDADQIARQVVELGSEGLAAVVKAFGAQVLAPDQSLDRQKMAALVFAHPEQLKKLEAILHPLIRSSVAAIQTKLKKQGERVAFYDVPLLFEKEMQDQFDAVLVVACSADLQKQRLKQRDQLDSTQIEQRLKNQWDIEVKKNKADYVIENTKDLQHLENQLEKVLIKMGLEKK